MSNWALETMYDFEAGKYESRGPVGAASARLPACLPACRRILKPSEAEKYFLVTFKLHVP